VVRFITEADRLQHFEDHAEGVSDEFNGRFQTPEEYEKGGVAFLNRPIVGNLIEQPRTKDGWRLRIDLDTDEFAICDRAGFLRTYYKANPFEHGKGDNLKYFRKRCLQ